MPPQQLIKAVSIKTHRKAHKNFSTQNIFYKHFPSSQDRSQKKNQIYNLW